MERYPAIRLVTNTGRHGFGMAVRAGLAQATGDAIAVMMADGSDSPRDLVRYYRKLRRGLRLRIWFAVYSRQQDRGLSGAQTGYQPHSQLVYPDAVPACNTTTLPTHSNVTAGKPSRGCSR